MAKGFGGGMPGNMKGLMQQAQKMQQELQKAQERAKDLTAEFSSGGGMVKAVASGQNQIVSLEIEKEIVDPEDIEILQESIMSACNGALVKVQEAIQVEIDKVTGGVNLPGMF